MGKPPAWPYAPVAPASVAAAGPGAVQDQSNEQYSRNVRGKAGNRKRHAQGATGKAAYNGPAAKEPIAKARTVPLTPEPTRKPRSGVLRPPSNHGCHELRGQIGETTNAIGVSSKLR